MLMEDINALFSHYFKTIERMCHLHDCDIISSCNNLE